MTARTWRHDLLRARARVFEIQAACVRRFASGILSLRVRCMRLLGSTPPVELAVKCQPLFLEQWPENLDRMMGSLEDLPTRNGHAATDEVTKTLARAAVDDLRHARTADG